MLHQHFYDTVVSKFGQLLSDSQQSALEAFCRFMFSGGDNSVFLLRGYAGTGKTTLVSAIVNTLTDLEYDVVLLAPTGRAAKIFSSYSGMRAYTVHKCIYRRNGISDGVEMFNLGFNKSSGTLYFVDEASMISDTTFDTPFGSGSLLDDMLQFIRNGRRNRLVLIGDDAQLPPVGTELSPALDTENLEVNYGFDVYHCTMTDIVRQAENSGILFNATLIRNFIHNPSGFPQLRTEGFPDIVRIGGEDLIEELDTCYSQFGVEETLVICRSNNRANKFNQGIRASVLYMEEEISAGDRIMIVKNNYRLAGGESGTGFIANGEMGTIIKTGRQCELYGHRFAKITLQLDDSDEETDTWAILDTLTSASPALTSEENKNFYLSVESDYADVKSKKKRMDKVMENEFYNALQIKFAYAVTCHKSQGGQWDAVFVDQGYVSEDMLGNEYWRWMYTAFTRARKKLYLLNFSKEFFKG